MTLIEVLAGLALLASVLGGILVTKARVSRQARLLDRREESAQSADTLLRGWFAEPGSIPVTGRGRVPGHADLAWRTSPIRNAQAEALGGMVVRLEITSAPEPDEALTSMEVVVPYGGKYASGVHAR